jgi:hypothetical protein
MRIRTILLLVFIALVAGLAALNIDEFTRQSLLSLGFMTVQVPLGLLMLALLVVTLLVFLGATIYIQSVNLIETRNYARELSTQRELADKAELSRFTELRQYLEVQASEYQRREQAGATVGAERLAQLQAALLARIEQSDHTTAAYMGELEDRLHREPKLLEMK